MKDHNEEARDNDISRRDFQKLAGLSGISILGGVSLAGCHGTNTESSLDCPYCDQAFQSDSALKDHLAKEHESELQNLLGEGPYPCPYGGEQYESLADLRAHLKSEHLDEINMPDKWDLETDVVVVGFGGSGACTALSAVDNGAAVTIIEKLAHGGGNTAMSDSNMTVPKKGRVDDAVTYFNELANGTIENDVIESWAEHAVDQVEWFESKGGKMEELEFGEKLTHMELEGSDSLTMYAYSGEPPRGMPFFSWIKGKAKSNENIEVMTRTPGKELVIDSDGRVRGVIAEQDGTEIALKARRGVVLACGGYGHNEELKRNTLRITPSIHHGNEGNTGDAIKMAQKAGAKMWKLNESAGHLGYEFDGNTYSSILLITMQVNPDQRGAILVNDDGDRFVNECVPQGINSGHVSSDLFQKSFLEYDVENKKKSNIPCYFIFDERVFNAGPLGPPYMGWSPDNTTELQKGWIKQADTIEGLAEKMGLGNLPETVENFNSWVSAGDMGPFGRTIGNRLENPPYYALEALPSIWCTIGGPKKDGDAQVLDVNDEKIPGLYVSGVASLGLNRFRYQMGTPFSDSMVFGRIAGKNVAQEEPWTQT